MLRFFAKYTIEILNDFDLGIYYLSKIIDPKDSKYFLL